MLMCSRVTSLQAKDGSWQTVVSVVERNGEQHGQEAAEGGGEGVTG